MILAKIIGSVVSTIKHECYNHHKLLLAKPISPQGQPQSGVILAVDAVGAGKGDVVLVASEGRAATELLGFSCRMPLRSIVLAIVDDPERLADTDGTS